VSLPFKAIPRWPNRADNPGARRPVRASRRPWSRIGPRLVLAVMVPVVALSALGADGVVQRYRDADAVSAVVTQVGRVVQTLHLYAGLVGEKTGSESIVVAAGLHLSPAQASSLSGFDIVAQLREDRAVVDAAIADGTGTILGAKKAQLVALRGRIDSGTATEVSVRPFFIDIVRISESAWLAQMSQLTQTSLKTVGSPELRRSVAGLADAVAAFIAGAKATTAAGALTVPGVPGTVTGVTDLAAQSALYARAASALGAELGGQGAVAWQQLIVNDPQVKTFQRFIASLDKRPSGSAAGTSIPEIARTFRNALIFQDHLRRVVDLAASDVLPLAHSLQAGAQRALERYLLALGVITGCSVVIAIVTARKIVGPLRRLAARASDVSAGVIDGDPLDASGPEEVASVGAAFNEIVANLVALDATALALATADLGNSVLATSVPGRIGESLRHSVDLLQQSIRDNDQLQQTLERNEARFRELADRSPDVIFRFSRVPEPHFEYLSPSFEHLTGIPVATVEADFRVFAGALDNAGRALVADVVADRHFQPHVDLAFRRKDGTMGVFDLRVVETPDGTQGVGRDVTEIRALQAQLAEQATRDPLTGLANRRLLDELLGRALRRANRSGRAITVAFLDLDHFKWVNDTYGHDAGDTVLRATAARLLTAVRDADVVARYGGDEFVVVYEGADDNDRIRLAERIEDALRGPIDIEGGVTVRCPVSVGIADTRSTDPIAASLIGAADRAMLEVKKARTPSPRNDAQRAWVRPVA
jgi:diguanylate cyclase (GGDEF)-like protein